MKNGIIIILIISIILLSLTLNKIIYSIQKTYKNYYNEIDSICNEYKKETWRAVFLVKEYKHQRDSLFLELNNKKYK